LREQIFRDTIQISKTEQKFLEEPFLLITISMNQEGNIMLRKMNTKQHLFMAGGVMAFTPLHITNEYLYSSEFITVIPQKSVTAGDVARRYTNDEKKTEKLQEAIIAVNDLKPAGSIREGQHVRVPVLTNEKK